MSNFMAFINSLYAFLVELFETLGIKLPDIFDKNPDTDAPAE